MTESWVIASACLAPLAIFAIAVLLRAVADTQPEVPWSSQTRTKLITAAYTLIGIGYFALMFAAIVGGAVGGALLIMLTLGIGQLIDIELKLAGKRRRTQQTEFLWLLATIVKNGRNLPDEIEDYACGTWGARHRRLMTLANRIRNGTELTEIAVPQGLLSRDITLEIQAGLRADRLYETLILAARRETRQIAEETASLRSQSLLMYPATILTAVSLIVAFLLYFIVPKLKKIFEDFGTELPEMTKMLVSLGDNIFSVWYAFLMLGLMLLTGVVVVAFADFHGWRPVTRFLLGSWLARIHTPPMLRAVAHAVAAGRPLHQAFEMLSSSSNSWLLQQRAEAIHLAIQQGHPCWQQLERQRFLRGGEVILLESAEQIGNLPWALNTVADSIERRWTYRLYAVSQVVGPLVIIAMGILVAFFAFAFFLPLVKLVNDLS